MEWRYNLGERGVKLKALINSEEETFDRLINVYQQMIQCLNYLKGQFTCRDFRSYADDIDSMDEDFEMSIPDKDDDSLNYSEEEENLNVCLSEFYDLCDVTRTWIGL